MIDPASPGSNPARVARPEVTDWSIRAKWGDSIALPVSQNDVTNINSPVDPANPGHADYLNGDPRANKGPANRRNPNSKNFSNKNPAVDDHIE